MTRSVVVMGVAGCGKSSLAAALAAAADMRLIEGDDFHDAANKTKMRDGMPLTDADRAGWLASLAAQLAGAPSGVVLTCSALKRAYRATLASSTPGLRFVFMEIDRAAATARVEARAKPHFFSPRLIDSQFAALESPLGEANVLRVDALQPITVLVREVLQWLKATEKSAAPT